MHSHSLNHMLTPHFFPSLAQKIEFSDTQRYQPPTCKKWTHMYTHTHKHTLPLHPQPSEGTFSQRLCGWTHTLTHQWRRWVRNDSVGNFNARRGDRRSPTWSRDRPHCTDHKLFRKQNVISVTDDFLLKVGHFVKRMSGNGKENSSQTCSPGSCCAYICENERDKVGLALI